MWRFPPDPFHIDDSLLLDNDLTNNLQTLCYCHCYFCTYGHQTPRPIGRSLLHFIVGGRSICQEPVPAKLYLGLGVGPIIPQSASANLNGTIAGTGTLKFNASGFVGLLIGYRLADHFGLEGEGGWTLYDSFSLTGSLSGSGGPLPGTIPLNGDMHTWLGLLNALYRPRQQRVRFAPYFGAGVGPGPRKIVSGEFCFNHGRTHCARRFVSADAA